MGETIAAEDLITYWPLALPAAILLTLLVLLIVSMKRRRKTKAADAHPHALAEIDPMSRDRDAMREESSAPDAEPAALDEVRAPSSAATADMSAEPPVVCVRPSLKSVPPSAQQLTAKPASAARETRDTAAAPPVADIGAIADKIAAAEANDSRKGELAALYLELARAYVADGRGDAALGAFRSAAGNGALHGPADVHAEARLALGEVAQAAGDLTGACEQWQIAKSVFHDLGMRDAHGKVDARMRANGCPTDWVLTEF